MKFCVKLRACVCVCVDLYTVCVCVDLYSVCVCVYVPSRDSLLDVWFWGKTLTDDMYTHTCSQTTHLSDSSQTGVEDNEERDNRQTGEQIERQIAWQIQLLAQSHITHSQHAHTNKHMQPNAKTSSHTHTNTPEERGRKHPDALGVVWADSWRKLSVWPRALNCGILIWGGEADDVAHNICPPHVCVHVCFTLTLQFQRSLNLENGNQPAQCLLNELMHDSARFEKVLILDKNNY